MTRETKIGLVVSCSFLCLVGTVVYLKLRQGAFWPGATGEADAELAASNGAPPDPEPTSSEQDKPEEVATVKDGTSAPPPAFPAPQGDEPSSGPGLSGAQVVPAGATSEPSPIQVDQAKTTPITTSASTSVVKNPLTIPAAEQKTSSAATASAQGKQPPKPPPPKFEDSDPPDTNPGRTAGPVTGGPATAAPTGTQASPSSKPDAGPSVPAPFSSTATSTRTKTTSTQTPEAHQRKGPTSTPKTADQNHPSDGSDQPPPFPASKDPFSKLPGEEFRDPPPDLDAKPNSSGSPAPRPKFPKEPAAAIENSPTSSSAGARGGENMADSDRTPTTNWSNLAGASTPSSPAATPRPEPSSFATANPTTVPLSTTTSEPGVKMGRPITGPAGASTSTDPRMEQAPGVSPMRPASTPPAGDDAPDRNTRTAATPMPNSPSTLLLGASIRAVGPPIMAPGPAAPTASATNTVAQAESWDEETYSCRANDTFRTISQRFYGSDRYERALLLFNRNHPLAADWIRQDSPTPPVGQAVYIPPVPVLEKRYANSIPGLTQLPAVIPASATEPAGNDSKPPAGYRQYQVRPTGERFLEIARRTLGSSDRWGDIYRLNQRYHPNELIPGGTILWLPPDARLEAADQP